MAPNPNKLSTPAESLAPSRAVHKSEHSPPRLITRKELRRMIPYTPQHILRLEKMGAFPKRIRLGGNRVAWLLSEIENWIAARAAERERGRHQRD